jgi:hypothetical protein
MSESRFGLAAAVALASLAAHAPSFCQQRLGIELQVTTFTVSRQFEPDVATEADGDFVVVWTGDLLDSSSYGIRGRRFSAAGTPQSPELQINQLVAGVQRTPAVVIDADGGFVVAWTNFEPGAAGISVRRFNSVGTALGPELRVNTYTASQPISPDVATNGDGSFVVVWHTDAQDGSGSGVFARRFGTDGSPVTAPFQVNTSTLGAQQFAAVAMDGEGRFVVAWEGDGDGDGLGVRARFIDPDILLPSTEFQVNSHTPSNQGAPDVAFDADGEIVVVWHSLGQDGDDRGVFTRRFNVNGAPQSGELQVNARTSAHQHFARVSADGLGGFVVAWDSDEQDGSSTGVFARRIGASGNPAGGELQVNSHFTYAQGDTAVAASASGDFVVTWASYLQDGDEFGVFLQRFASSFVIDVDGDGALLPLTDGLLLLRFLFGFTGNVLVNGAVNLAGCTRCTAAEIEAFLDGLI